MSGSWPPAPSWTPLWPRAASACPSCVKPSGTYGPMICPAPSAPSVPPCAPAAAPARRRRPRSLWSARRPPPPGARSAPVTTRPVWLPSTPRTPPPSRCSPNPTTSMAFSPTWPRCGRWWTCRCCARTSLSTRSRCWPPGRWAPTPFCSCSRSCPTTSTASWRTWPAASAWGCSQRSPPRRRCTGRPPWARRSLALTIGTCAPWPPTSPAPRSSPPWLRRARCWSASRA